MKAPNNVEKFRKEPEPSQHDPRTCGCDKCFYARVAADQAEQNERRAQQKAAEARLMEYVAAGLAQTESNRDIFIRAWKSHPKLSAIEIPTVQLVDAVIALVRDKLSWRKPAPAPAPPEPELVLLSDGSPQKSLDEAPSSNWTVPQLRDWFKRQGGQQQLLRQQFGGSHRGSFFKADSQIF